MVYALSCQSGRMGILIYLKIFRILLDIYLALYYNKVTKNSTAKEVIDTIYGGKTEKVICKRY